MPPSTVDIKIANFYNKYPLRHFSKGQVILFAGEDPKYVYYLKSGRIRAYDISGDGEEVVVHVFNTETFFPAAWAIVREPNRYFYKAETDTALRVVPVDDSLAFIRDNPDVMYNTLLRLYRTTEGLLSRIARLMSGTARSRLLHELIIACRRFGELQPDGSIQLNASGQDLAAHSGLSRETVSREMQKLKEAGWVNSTTAGITITNLTALETALGDAIQLLPKV